MPQEPPGLSDGVIVDASYWRWIDEQREAAIAAGAIVPAIGERVEVVPGWTVEEILRQEG